MKSIPTTTLIPSPQGLGIRAVVMWVVEVTTQNFQPKQHISTKLMPGDVKFACQSIVKFWRLASSNSLKKT
jgi:hypothetical protein